MEFIEVRGILDDEPLRSGRYDISHYIPWSLSWMMSFGIWCLWILHWTLPRATGCQNGILSSSGFQRISFFCISWFTKNPGFTVCTRSAGGITYILSGLGRNCTVPGTAERLLILFWKRICVRSMTPHEGRDMRSGRWHCNHDEIQTALLLYVRINQCHEWTYIFLLFVGEEHEIHQIC